jgi:penicillin-binding protein-related factor A (putative recombinase)
LRKAGRDLADYNVCRFWKFPEEMMRTPCDFMGFTNTGRAILIEAKEVDRTALSIHNPPGLAPHQFTALKEANNAGAISLVCWARKNICATISFDMVLRFSHGRASVPWASIERKYHRKLTGEEASLRLLDHWLPVIGLE